jgi:branched-chain amino acid transport system substrate-binding protein
MSLTRRGLLATGTATAAASTILPRRARAQKPVIKIGVLNDQSGPYRDLNGPTSVICTKMAVQEFAAQGFDVQVIDADHQNKADIASSIARQWIDQQGVDMIMDCAGSSAALALNSLCREKDKVLLPTSTATSDLTGSQCTPNTIHWVYDTYMLAKVVGAALAKAGGDSWYFITPNYAFGHALQRDATAFITAAGGKVLGANVYPFPETTDFSGPLLQAKASGAKVIGLASAGADTVNCIKQAREFGIVQSGVKMASLLFASTDVRAVGLEAAQGLQMTEAYYWDLNDRTRRFNDKAKGQMRLWPNSFQAGNYSAALHYLKAVTAMGAAEAKKSGRAVVERMKAMPTDDDCFGAGKIREDGRKIHPAYLLEVKKPSESKHEWDLLKLVATTPAEETFRPLSETACPLVKKS